MLTGLCFWVKNSREVKPLAAAAALLPVYLHHTALLRETVLTWSSDYTF